MKKKNIGCAVLAASALLALGSAFTASASEWTIEDGEWAYRDNSGEYVKDTWQTDGNNTFYLGNDGYMVRSSLIEVNDNYYYVNSSGAMVKNEWRQLENADWQSESPEDTNWYYFDDKGRALRSDGSAKVQTIGGKKYIFDEYGRMLTGWITESAEFSTDEDAWIEALYYADAEEGDGSILTNAWLNISVHDEDNEDDTEPAYWFYFSAGGKKTTDQQKTINSKKYLFDENGAAQSGWIQNDETGSWQYYGSEDDCSLKTGWFETVPDEDLHAEANSDETSYWYYATSSNAIATSQIKTINSKTYAFNEYGEMLTGLYKLKVENKTITEYAEIDTEDDLPQGEDDGWGVYLFHETNGDMRTGTQTVELDGENYTYYFDTAGSDKGHGINGIEGNYIYDNGKRLKAESGTKYQVVTYDGEDYLVNTSGVLAKKKTNVTDSDGIYYCTGEKGEVTYTGSEKYED